jgi:hypothetical protein
VFYTYLDDLQGWLGRLSWKRPHVRGSGRPELAQGD